VTFLQYVCWRLLGQPDHHGAAYGDSYWSCPFHKEDTPSFHTMPSKPGYKDRWRCFGCGMGGDEADLMAGLMPGEDWNRRRARLMEWRQDYELGCGATANAIGHVAASGDFFPGTGRCRDQDARLEERAAKHAEVMWGNLTDAERRELIRLKDKVGEDVSLDLLAVVCRQYREWFERGDAEHRAECNDPVCWCRMRAAVNGEVR
jgi:hypothetical protein